MRTRGKRSAAFGRCAVVVAASAAALCATAVPAWGAAGQPIPSYGTTGVVRVPIGATGQAVPLSTVSDGNGGQYMAGYFLSLANRDRAFVAHVLSDGSLDPSFGNVPGSRGYYNLNFGDATDAEPSRAVSIVRGSDGKLTVAVANRTDPTPGSQETGLMVLRLTAAGDRDTSFGGPALAGVDANFGTQPTGVVNYCYSGNPADPLDVPIWLDGCDSGTGHLTKTFALKLMPDNSVAVLGRGGAINAEVSLVARLQADGAPTSSFGDAGAKVLLDHNFVFTALELSDDGAVTVAGTQNFGVDESGRLTMARLTANGQPDPTYGTGGVLLAYHSGIGTDIDLGPGGSALVAVTSVKPGVSSSGGVVAITGDGKDNHAYGNDGIAPAGVGNETLVMSHLARDPSGRLYLTGFLSDRNAPLQLTGDQFPWGVSNGLNAVAVMRFLGNGLADTTWAPDGFARSTPAINPKPGVSGITINSNGDVTVAGAPSPPNGAGAFLYRLQGGDANADGNGAGCRSLTSVPSSAKSTRWVRAGDSYVRLYSSAAGYVLKSGKTVDFHLVQRGKRPKIRSVSFSYSNSTAPKSKAARKAPWKFSLDPAKARTGNGRVTAVVKLRALRRSVRLKLPFSVLECNPATFDAKLSTTKLGATPNLSFTARARDVKLSRAEFELPTKLSAKLFRRLRGVAVASITERDSRGVQNATLRVKTVTDRKVGFADSHGKLRAELVANPRTKRAVLRSVRSTAGLSELTLRLIGQPGGRKNHTRLIANPSSCKRLSFAARLFGEDKSTVQLTRVVRVCRR